MSLIIKNRGTNSSLFTLGEGCFTKVNPAEIAGERAPYGVLGGSVAALSGNADYEVVAGDGTLHVVGLFLNNAEGANFENSPAAASGKIAICQKQASVEVDVYEQVNYALGDNLYCSENGFLTNVESANKEIIGIVTKVPTPACPLLGLDMRI